MNTAGVLRPELLIHHILIYYYDRVRHTVSDLGNNAISAGTVAVRAAECK
jgi:hypothetical protein